MSKPKFLHGPIGSGAFQAVLDALDVAGNWSWDARSDRACADTFVALLFNVDPKDAQDGLPLATFIAGIHPEDRARALALFRDNAREGRPYATEYRVCSADGVSRWVLSRGRFLCDHLGRPVTGRGIIVDITCLKTEREFVAVRDAEDPVLDRAADAAIAAHRAVSALQDPGLKARADALLFEIGRRFAQRQFARHRKRMN